MAFEVESVSNSHPKGPKYLYGTKYGFCSSNFPYGLGKYTPYGYIGPFGSGSKEQSPTIDFVFPVLFHSCSQRSFRFSVPEKADFEHV